MERFETNKNGTEEKAINVEQIMEKLRENICKRKESTICSAGDIGDFQRNLSTLQTDDGNIQKDFEYINSNWDTKNNSYFISSHRPIVGKFLVRGRELVNGEIKRYVDPILWKQAEFNGGTVRFFNYITGKFNHYNNEIELLRFEIDSKMEELRSEFEYIIEQLRSEIDSRAEDLRPEFEDKIKGDIISEINNIVRSNVDIIAALTKFETLDTVNLDINYFRFEEQFRGSREDIKQRQSNFKKYFIGCSNVLDIGCGRGEFLELLKEFRIGGKGVDIDSTMVDYCLSKGLKVEQEDAISYLENLEDKSLDGIFIDQVVEHLEPSYLINLLQLCFQKLNYGYYIFVETVNPLSFVSLANFYIDMTHKKPIHPETLKFLLTSVGFRDLEIKFVSPVPEEAILQKVSMNSDMEKWTKNYLDTYNYNIEKLNNILYGAQDYVVISKK